MYTYMRYLIILLRHTVKHRLSCFIQGLRRLVLAMVGQVEKQGHYRYAFSGKEKLLLRLLKPIKRRLLSTNRNARSKSRPKLLAISAS